MFILFHLSLQGLPFHDARWFDGVRFHRYVHGW
jgi:hypothetical protein